MVYFKRLDRKGNCYYINSREKFNAIEKLPSDLVEIVFNFAYEMTFGQKGEHRAHRTGGTHQRRNGEIFANTFQAIEKWTAAV